MTARRLGLIAGAAVLFAGLTAGFLVLLKPLAILPPPHRGEGDLRFSASEERGEAFPPAPVPVATAASLLPTLPPEGGGSKAEFTGPRVAILITDAGDDAAATKAAADALPFEIGFAFPPGAGSALAGRERWLSMPMQPASYPRVDPGPDTLLVGAAASDNLRRLDHALGNGTPVGVTSMMGSAFTTDASALGPVMAALKARGLKFIDARATPASIAAREARAAGVASAANRRFIDAGGSVTANLRALEAAARRDGSAVGFARPLPGTTAAIARWSKGLEARGLRLETPGSLTR